MRTRLLTRLLCLALLLGATASCTKKKTEGDLPLMAKMELYGFRPYARLEDRIVPMPPRLLELYRQMDGRPDYKAYHPSPEEKALFLEYLRLMPPAVDRLFRAKCVGLYFVEGFMGNGMTSWVVNEMGQTYFHMTLNPAAFRQTLSETLTERESSCFIPAEGWKISVEAGTKYKGLAYAVFHEAAHAMDYMAGITPLVDPDLPERFRPPFRPDGGIFTKSWTSHSVPAPGGDYPYRDKLTFYGLGGGPKIPVAEAPGIYKGLLASPFASLYGSKSWAEDLAELTAYGLIARKLGQPYKITVTGPAGKSVSEPMKGRAGRRAEAILKLLEKI